MKAVKRLFLCMLLLMPILVMGTTSAYAAEETTAKQVLKKALKYKQAEGDLVLVDFDLKEKIYVSSEEETNDTSTDYYLSMQMQKNKVLGEANLLYVENEEETGGNIYYECDEVKNSGVTYTLKHTDTAFQKETLEQMSDYADFRDYSKLYSYMSSIKYSKTTTKKNGISAYYITAKLDVAKYISNETDEFASSFSTIYGTPTAKSGQYATVKAWVEKKSGKLIAMTINLKDYTDETGLAALKSIYEYYDYMYSKEIERELLVSCSTALVSIEINPKTYSTIHLPKDYVEEIKSTDGYKTTKYYVDGTLSKMKAYNEDGFVVSYYKNGKLSKKVVTKYKDELATTTTYKDGKKSSSEQTIRTDSITVSDTSGLLNAIGNYNVIYLEEGTYNLSSLKFANDAYYTSNIYANQVKDGTEIQVMKVTNMKLIGKGEVSIVTEPRYANVLVFSGCSNIELKNITFGHTKEQGTCVGGVLYLKDSSDFEINHCNMYGCGTEGISTCNVKNLAVKDSSIYECSLAIMLLTETTTASFKDCIFRDCRGFDMITLYNSDGITYDNCEIYGHILEGDYEPYLIAVEKASNVTLKDCNIHDNSKDFVLVNDANVVFDNCRIRE